MNLFHVALKLVGMRCLLSGFFSMVELQDFGIWVIDLQDLPLQGA